MTEVDEVDVKVEDEDEVDEVVGVVVEEAGE